ncbi:sigma 54-interacting transcriptional regulator [Lacticaseibacillus absianus]|uniref:sigma 54-interacting transcriptional regulator n=1 Tax=Lacticaseibacillus absianus TaxID=2729623 RepID=UPI001FEC582D|nr:sigma 54-interacting transcriptional regulator [Lacticaseibacillus absianus]
MKEAMKRVYRQLGTTANTGGATTQELADQLGLSRSVVSQYLNRLEAQDWVTKRDGRPVRWQRADAQADEADPFTQFIGVRGSVRRVIEQAAAAVAYPPHGLNVLVTGHSGVGKSYLAATIVAHARYVHAIVAHAPYAVLNCADYANNPELLSSLLFGYVRGAFTGADQDKAGLLTQADGGYLFLDEVHRLSSENQEKLFSFIDNGYYYRMGDNVTRIQATVRLIMATTETPEQVLLATFRRRIPVVLHLPDYAQRPADERLALLRALFTAEAHKMACSIMVTPAVVSALAQIDHPGNIGHLKNLIQVGCATAYERRQEDGPLRLTLDHFQFDHLPDVTAYGEMVIDPAAPVVSAPRDPWAEQLAQISDSLAQAGDDPTQEQLRQWTNLFQALLARLPQHEPEDGLHLQHDDRFKTLIERRFGLAKAAYLEPLMFALYRRRFELDPVLTRHLTRRLRLKLPRALHVAKEFYRVIQPLDPVSHQTLVVVLTLLLADHIDERIQLRGLLTAHGESTATSIQAVVNTLCGTYVFDAIDMPITTGVDSIIKEANRLIDQSDTTNGFILMVDMGSLSQLFTAIKPHLDGDLLVVNNLTTVTALDLALRMQQRLPFKQIAEKAEQDYTIEVQYYQGFSQATNILVSCISGLGIAEKIREIMQPLMPSDIKVIPLDYATLKEKLVGEEWAYFDQTLFVLTTMDLTRQVPFAHLNIYDLLDATGASQLSEWLSAYLDQAHLKALNAELLRFFSIEGISERLSFLNPDIVIKEVETAIMKYEHYYHFVLDGKVKLNLYMHIALMIERLMVRKQIETPVTMSGPEEAEFMQVSHSVFQPIEMKYNITVSDYELSLMYELFKQFIEA